MISAAGVASQMPLTPNIRGRIIMAAIINTKDLENASTADTMPLESAVNIPLANMLKPMKSNAMVHTLFPVTARSKTGLSGRVNTDTKGSVRKNDAAAVKTEITAMTFKLTLARVFSFP